ncbi:hypothetical protein [Pseudohongiella sp.]|uniref:Uncharacterized protein n=1 Tax=marine sediment metagenome TaxID=412755 RepID=A0A0F9W3P6_9ZZZZ|nr:hypothetical protein [Pseudohongiella sp.]HDZ10048.1 hypothetical protein [Pseudohongiella sp.]HEA63397.1 hypothetical protein [Pseudohongiella sp.]
MSRINWNKVQPTSITHAMELCVGCAREKKNLSVERIAELMGLAGHHSLYKWMAEGRMPAVLVRPFEHACGASFVSRYMAHSAQYLTLKIPSGSKADARDINALQSSLTSAVGALIKFHDAQLSQDDCIAALTGALENLAWHRANVEKADTPELSLFEEEIQ